MKVIGGFLGLMAMVAAIVVGTLATFGNSPLSSSGAKPAEEVESSEVTASAIGKTVRSEDVDWTVNEVRWKREINSYTSPPSTESGPFVIVDFTAENTSKRPATLTGTSMALVDSGGTLDFPAASTNVGYVRPELHILFNEHGLLAPGEKKEGRVIFDLAPFGRTPAADLSGFRLRLYGEKDPNVNEVPHADVPFGSSE